MDKDNYLARFDGNFKANTFDNLAELQLYHMRNIPFENLDVIRKVPIYLNLERIYEKIVVHKRGGYCYEVNGLFHWLLEELGFEAHLMAATVMRPTGEWAKENTHATILVMLDRPYLVDVGFGDSAHQPVPLDGTMRTDVSGTYKVKQQTDTKFDLLRKHGSAWRTLYRFNTVKKQLVDFHEGCVFNQVAKESTFTHYDLVTIATEDGRMTLADQTLTITKNGCQQKRELSNGEKMQVLQATFGLNVK